MQTSGTGEFICINIQNLQTVVKREYFPPEKFTGDGLTEFRAQIKTSLQLEIIFTIL